MAHPNQRAVAKLTEKKKKKVKKRSILSSHSCKCFQSDIVGCVNETMVHSLYIHTTMVSRNIQTLRIQKNERPQHALRCYVFYRPD